MKMTRKHGSNHNQAVRNVIAFLICAQMDGLAIVFGITTTMSQKVQQITLPPSSRMVYNTIQGHIDGSSSDFLNSSTSDELN